MIRSLRDIFGLLLAALIVITALHVGAARGQAEVAGRVVLCTGAELVSVAVDAKGQPVGHVTTCPECVMSVLAGLATPVPQMLRAVRTRRMAFARSRVAGRSHGARLPPARGPPPLS